MPIGETDAAFDAAKPSLTRTPQRHTRHFKRLRHTQNIKARANHHHAPPRLHRRVGNRSQARANTARYLLRRQSAHHHRWLLATARPRHRRSYRRTSPIRAPRVLHALLLHDPPPSRSPLSHRRARRAASRAIRPPRHAPLSPKHHRHGSGARGPPRCCAASSSLLVVALFRPRHSQRDCRIYLPS